MPQFILDFGDAPDAAGLPASGNPYPTLLEHDGARHILSSGLFLGASVDAEADGQPNATATGDDVAGAPDDEDGVVFTSPLIPGSMATVTVTASAPGLLDAWLDFTNDGDWGDAGEQIFASTSLMAGSNSLSFAVPAGAAVGAQTFARFRLSSAGGLLPTGLAADGEVEDHAVDICGTTVTNTNNSGAGSLRLAIQCSNGATGVQTIGFAIPGAGTHTISPISPLPTITGPAVIDGTCQHECADRSGQSHEGTLVRARSPPAG